MTDNTTRTINEIAAQTETSAKTIRAYLRANWHFGPPLDAWENERGGDFFEVEPDGKVLVRRRQEDRLAGWLPP